MAVRVFSTHNREVSNEELEDAVRSVERKRQQAQGGGG